VPKFYQFHQIHPCAFGRTGKEGGRRGLLLAVCWLSKIWLSKIFKPTSLAQQSRRKPISLAQYP
jgi:hypothetical protein